MISGEKKLSVRRAERKGRIGHLSCRSVTSGPWRVNSDIRRVGARLLTRFKRAGIAEEAHGKA